VPAAAINRQHMRVLFTVGFQKWGWSFGGGICMTEGFMPLAAGMGT
jgi:hypothetical protein